MTLNEYTQALRRHDWGYEFSDDQSVWRRGRDERAALLHARPQLDPDASLWNAHAPAHMQIVVIEHA